MIAALEEIRQAWRAFRVELARAIDPEPPTTVTFYAGDQAGAPPAPLYAIRAGMVITRTDYRHPRQLALTVCERGR